MVRCPLRGPKGHLMSTHLSIHFHLPHVEVVSQAIVARIGWVVHQRRYGILLQMSIEQAVRRCIWVVQHLVLIYRVVQLIYFGHSSIKAHSEGYTSMSTQYYWPEKSLFTSNQDWLNLSPRSKKTPNATDVVRTALRREWTNCCWSLAPTQHFRS